MNRPSWWRRDYLVALLVCIALAALLNHDWDGFVFQASVRQFWAGHSPYAVAQARPYYAYLGPTDTETQWYAYPPLPLLAMAVTYAPAVFLHLGAPVERVLLKLPMILATLALAAVAAAWARRLGSSEDEVRRVERRFLFNPFLLLVGAAWGMTDTALVALYMGGILAYRNKKPGKAGALMALATLIKPFPALLLLPIVPYLLDRHGWKAFGRFAAAGVLTALPIVVPFLLANPAGFWQQSVAMHLARLPQGVTPWTLWPLRLLSPKAISVTSLLLMCGSLLGVGWAATRLRGRGTSLMLTLLAAIAVLVWNRVLNEQYLVLVVAPLLILDQAHQLDRYGHFLTRWTPSFFAVTVLLGGFHFLTFLPPDVAMPLLHAPVDVVAQRLRDWAPWFWRLLQGLLEYTIIGTLVALGILGVRLVAHELRREGAGPVRHHFGPIAGACAVLLVMGIVPALGASTTAPAIPFVPAYGEPRVAAFYYLWWENPAHDPAIPYGNWEACTSNLLCAAKPPRECPASAPAPIRRAPGVVVTQVPEMGYYTTNRGVERDHVRQMVASGIDTAIVSYHRGEQDRYRTFQEEAQRVGLRVTPLIELNQVYDDPCHHPRNETGGLQPFAAYRLDNGTRQAIEDFVLDLKGQLTLPSTLRVDGRPVVYFYDSYVSGVSFAPEDKRSLARVLLDLQPIDVLREAFHDPGLQPTVDSLVRDYPSTYNDFYRLSAGSSLWRQAHLEQHIRFWRQIRDDLAREVGPLYLVSGDAFNDRAGFEAGTVKSLADLQVLDGAFIYSPSFTWGNQPKAPFNDTFALWEDRNHWLMAFAAGQGRLSSYGIAPSYDDTANRPNGFAIPAFPPEAGGESFYDLSWQSALRNPPGLAAVATFNEFFEGSGIEPTREHGDRFLAATLHARGQLETRNAPRRDITVLVHEWSSRTNPAYAETDLSHFWGMDLLAAGYRGYPDATFTALDALQPRIPGDGTPDLLLVEGGRSQFSASAQVVDRLAQWTRSAVPTIVFGSDVALPLNAPLGDNCLAGLDRVPDPQTLAPGDVVRAKDGGLWLDRAGHTYRVGQTCGTGHHAGTSFKPWRYSPGVDAQCLQVAVAALQPAFAAPDAPQSCKAR
jgi:hypothetical protein